MKRVHFKNELLYVEYTHKFYSCLKEILIFQMKNYCLWPTGYNPGAIHSFATTFGKYFNLTSFQKKFFRKYKHSTAHHLNITSMLKA